MPDVANRALNDARSLGSIRAGLLSPDGVFARSTRQEGHKEISHHRLMQLGWRPYRLMPFHPRFDRRPVERIQHGIDAHQQALDFILLIQAALLLQPL
jgi:hypothetical protein